MYNSIDIDITKGKCFFSQFKQEANCEILKLFFWGVPMGY